MFHALLEGFDYELAEFFITLLGNERAFVTSAHETAVKFVYRCVEENRCPVGIHVLHVVKETRGTTSAGYDYILEIGYLMQHGSFYFAETIFSFFCKYFAYSAVITALDVIVEVDERDAGNA